MTVEMNSSLAPSLIWFVNGTPKPKSKNKNIEIIDKIEIQFPYTSAPNCWMKKGIINNVDKIWIGIFKKSKKRLFRNFILFFNFSKNKNS